jgi:DNA-binding transcriptional regulator YhcF (GntR family)
MDLTVNRQSQLPIHVQLKAQLTHLIQAGQLAPGTRLPTVRQLAGFLRINRNTAARVFADLEREGYLMCERGRGTFVAQPRADRGAAPPRMTTLARLVDKTLAQAQRLGFRGSEFAAALYTRANAVPARVPRKLPVLFNAADRSVGSSAKGSGIRSPSKSRHRW